MKDGSGGTPNGGSSPGRARQVTGMEKPMPIAIIGMACRLPGNVSNLTSFWDFCYEARNSWTEFPPERLNTAAFHHPNAEKAGCVSAPPSSLDRNLLMLGRSFKSRGPICCKTAWPCLMRRFSISPRRRRRQLILVIDCFWNVLTKHSKIVESP